ncbi:MAG: 4Fe-4S binding protein [Candidatus Omnitrophica bacterium]|nr:4Fe-4S binding protein [Candidatus Omnitrophota bacterium]
MRYPKLRELVEAIKAVIKGPYTSSFPYKPHKPFSAFRGRTEFHEKDCVGCTACAQVCPSGAITFRDEPAAGKAKRVLTVRWDLCIFCGNCQANCLTAKGIMLSNDFDISTTGKRVELRQTIEKELVLCECCGETIAPYDQIVWTANKLGPLVFSNASLMLFYLGRMSLAETDSGMQIPRDKKELKRNDRIKILCPKCRREAVIRS